MESVYAIREPAVAGLFYPAGAGELAALVGTLLTANKPAESPPRALVVPHAGYRYSGAVAGQAWGQVAGQVFARVVLLGPPHRVPVYGFCGPQSAFFRTPLGQVPVDRAGLDRLASEAGLKCDERAHALEHSMEVHLPFIQQLPGAPQILPILVGEAEPQEVARLLSLVDDGRTLLVASSDLSHFLPYEAAREKDQDTLDRIQSGRTDLAGDQACGCRSVNGLGDYARAMGWRPEILCYQNSGDTAGDRERVVGYGAVAWFDG